MTKLTTNSHLTILLIFGPCTAFLPALLRWAGDTTFLPSTGRLDEAFTVLLCAIGAALVGSYIYNSLGHRSRSLAIAVTLIGSVSVFFIALYTNVFSLFAF